MSAGASGPAAPEHTQHSVDTLELCLCNLLFQAAYLSKKNVCS